MATGSSPKITNNTFDLTEEEVEELLNKKIEQIRRKNEERMKKHKLKEEDRQMAEKSGRSVTLHLTCSSKKVHSDEFKPNATSSCTSTSESVELGTNNSTRLKDAEKSQPPCLRITDTRGTETKQRYQKSPLVEPMLCVKCKHLPLEDSLETMTNWNLDEREKNWLVRSYLGHEPAVTSPKAKDVLESPPPDPSYNFLADRTRDGCVSQEKSSNRRHHRNFGGNSFENAAHKVQHTNDRKDLDPVPSVPQSKMEYQLATTGKERLEYAKWKSEQEKIDQARLRRHMNDAGEWRREWDRDKINLESEDNSIALSNNHHAEASRRSEHRPRRNEDSRRFLSKQASGPGPVNDLRSRLSETRSSGVSNDTPNPDRYRAKPSNPRRRRDVQETVGNTCVRKDGEMNRVVGSGRLSLACDDGSGSMNDKPSAPCDVGDGHLQTSTPHRRQNRRGKWQRGQQTSRKNPADRFPEDIGCNTVDVDPHRSPSRFAGEKKGRKGKLADSNVEGTRHAVHSMASRSSAVQNEQDHGNVDRIETKVQVAEKRQEGERELGTVNGNEDETALTSRDVIPSVGQLMRLDSESERGDNSTKTAAGESLSNAESNENSDDDEDEWEDVEDENDDDSNSDEMTDKFEDSLCDLEVK